MLIDGKPEGKGLSKYLDNDKYNRKEYNGFMHLGVRNGDATLTYINGDYFQGTFENGHFNEGKYYSFEDGEYFKGHFKNDQPYNGSWYNNSNQIITNINNGK